LTDHLGSTSLLTTEAGQEVAGTRLKYYAYGAPRPGSASSTHDAFARGYTPATYTGQTRDASTGLMYYGARFFDPQLGMFLAPDSIVPEPGNPAALNRYSYVLGNPLRYTDPTGHANECGIYGGTSCGDYGPKIPVESVQAPPDALDNVWAVTELIGSVLAEPADWVITARDFLNGNGSPWALVGVLPFVPSSAGKWVDEAVEVVTNALPKSKRFARAVPKWVAELIETGDRSIRLAPPKDSDVFITAAKDLSHYRTQSGVERRLTLSPGRRAVVTFDYDLATGSIASPILRDNPGFAGRGLTAGGAREWVIPNFPLDELSIRNIRVRWLRAN